MLDEDAFGAATAGPDWANGPTQPLARACLDLSRHTVAFVTADAS
jgi:hypothetical protein